MSGEVIHEHVDKLWAMLLAFTAGLVGWLGRRAVKRDDDQTASIGEHGEAIATVTQRVASLEGQQTEIWRQLGTLTQAQEAYSTDMDWVKQSLARIEDRVNAL